MALSPPPATPPEGLRAIPWLLFEDERGTAAVEMVVLIPIYVLLLTAVYAFGEMSMARQALAMAGRFHLWGGASFTDEEVSKGFFGPYHGVYTREALSGDNTLVSLQEADVRPTPVDLGDGGGYQEHDRAGVPIGGADLDAAVKIAAKVLANDLQPDALPSGYPSGADARTIYGSGQIALKRRFIKCSWQHTGITFGLAPTTTWRGSLLVWNEGHVRGEFKDGQQYHWVGHPQARPAPHMFEPAQWDGTGKNRYLSPEKTTPGGTATATQPLMVRNDGGDKQDPGLWDVNARINGSIEAEHGFYRSKGP